MARRHPPRKVTYFEPVPPRLARNTIIESNVRCRPPLPLHDRFVELDCLRRELEPFYSAIGRPSIDPELIIRMLIVGYCFGICSERRLCEEVYLNSPTAGFAGWGTSPRPCRHLSAIKAVAYVGSARLDGRGPTGKRR